ncbi:MAG: hypothetical protein M1837_000671 [Sclerophora amabilis]|nr:MAG: hypothetical protein M1837_000671 [Sclerophora amabilis]
MVSFRSFRATSNSISDRPGKQNVGDETSSDDDWSPSFAPAEISSSVNSNEFRHVILAPLPTACAARSRPESINDSSLFEPPGAAHTSWDQDFNRNLRRPISRRPYSFSNPARSLQRSPQRSPLRSPTKERGGFIPTLTGDTSGEIIVEKKTEGLASWFNGSSAPVTLGISVSEESTMDFGGPPPTSHSPARLHKKSASQPYIKQALGSTSRFSLFGSKSPAEKTPKIAAATVDELLDLNVNEALFPDGPVDTFSPSSFKNFQVNAEGILLKLHTAYKVQSTSLSDALSRETDLQDQLEEAETRSDHLKMQLNNMAAQASEQEQAMKELAAEIEMEKQRRQDEQEARKRSIILVKNPRSALANEVWDRPTTGKDVVKRSSCATVATDSGFESEGESSADSVFSRSRSNSSPTGIMFSSSTAVRFPYSYDPQVSSWSITNNDSEPVLEASADPNLGTRGWRPAPVQRTSTFQKVLEGLSSTSGLDDPNDTETQLVSPLDSVCANCQGGGASKAWSAVRDLRSKNKELTERVGQLEGTVDSCLDLVGGLRA